MAEYRTRKRIKKNNNSFLVLGLCVILASIILGVSFLYQRYSLSKERVNLDQYVGVVGNDIAIFLNDKQIEANDGKLDRGFYSYSSVYLPLSFVKRVLNNRFYYAKDLNKILYSLPDETKQYGEADIHQVGNAPYVIMKDEPYLLAEYVKDFTNMRFDSFLDTNNKRVYLYTDWDVENIAYIKSHEAARLLGGNKSPIVVNCKKGEEVKILNKMTKWSKVKTSTGYIGFVRNTKLKDEKTYIPKSTFRETKKEDLRLNEKLLLGFHQLFSNYKSSGLTDLLKNTKGMNVIAPTWYVIRNDEGDIRSIANAEYALSCHNRGLKVFATLNNFDLGKVDNYKIFSSAIIRKKMIDKILREVSVCNLDGINLDIENLKKSEGEHYLQFVRELSIELTKRKVNLSIDSYVPYAYNSHYDIEEYSKFCDYVIIMAYDEHYAGSEITGSVSSQSFVEDAIKMSLTSVEKDKLVIALPFYTRIWTTQADGTVTSATLDSQTAEDSAKNRGIVFEYDEVTGQNYGTFTTGEGVKVECWLEDDTSLKNKMSLIKKYNLAGTAAWKLTQERKTFIDIINMNKSE